MGNIWRFPYVVGENGGGAFLLLYIFLAMTVGLSILIAELIIGRNNESSLLKVSKIASKTSKKPLFWFGRLSIFITIVILAYYSVVSGWVLHYLTQFLTGLFSDDYIKYIGSIDMTALKSSGSLQFSLASVHLLICGYIVAKGDLSKFEKLFTKILPVLVFLFTVLLFRSFSLESSQEVMRFLFYPDFSKLNMTSLGRALGHVFFTLSIGLGILATYGAYFKNDVHLPAVGFRVTIIDMIVSIMALLMVFPVAFLSDTSHYFKDPGLLFEALPQLFIKMRYGEYFGLMFFLCLWLVAINASVGLLETLVANLRDKFRKLNRMQATLFTVTGVLMITVLPAYSSSSFLKMKWLDQSFIENLDSFLINYMMPLSGLGIIILFFYSMNEAEYKEKFIATAGKNSQAMYSHWLWVLRWMAPVLIVLALFMQLLDLFW